MKQISLLCAGVAVVATGWAFAENAECAKLKMFKPPARAISNLRTTAAPEDSAGGRPGRLPFRDFFGPTRPASLLGSPGARSRPQGSLPATVSAGESDTMKVLAIRVDFLTDRGGSQTSTPDGKFDLRSADQLGAPESLVDPPPHNRDYFMAHMKALSNYYYGQSYGRLVLEYDVFPVERDSAYHLSDTMDYGPWAISQDSLIVRAARDVFIDSIEAADSSGDIDFSEYDAYVVFHAGPDFQSDINYDSRRDIPSYTIPLFEDSVAVNGGSHYVHLGMVMPECTYQDGFLGALNGVLAHEFGHVLGLPDLYDINTLYPVVGDFSLMDTGGMLQGVLEDPDSGDLYAVYGLLPVSLDIWSKAILWPQRLELQVVDSAVDTELEAIQTSPRGLFALINNEEYFLVENRQVDLDGDMTVVLNADPETGVVMGPEGNEYDFLMPGLGGILVWHIDESAIFGRNVGPYFGVNSNSRRRGIKLEEADGIRDIGNIFSIYFTGSPEEPFYLGNNTLFSADSDPSSGSNSGGHSHVRIEVFDPPRPGMRVKAEREWGRAGWPVWLRSPMAEGSVWAGPLSTPDNSVAFVTTDSVLNIGEPSRNWRNVQVKLPGAPIPGISGRSRSAQEQGALYASVPGYGVLAFKPDGMRPDGWSSAVKSVSTCPSVTEAGVLVGLEDGVIAALDRNGDLLWTAGDGGGPVVSPLVVEDLDGDGALDVAFATQGGKIWVVEEGGSTKDGWPMQWRDGVVWLTAGDLDRETPPAMELIAADSAGAIDILDLGGAVAAGWRRPGVRLAGSRPSIADVDGDGFLEASFVSEDGDLYLMNHNANVATNWPYNLDSGGAPDSIRWVSSPVMADVDEDGLPEVLVGSLNGDIVALDAGGSVCEGWPYSFGLPVRTSPLICDVYGDGGLSLVAGGDDGVLYSLFPPAALSGEESAPWPRYGRSSSLANAFPVSLLGEPQLPAELMPEQSVYVYPSPVVGDRAYLRFTLAERAEVTATIIDIRGQEVAVLRDVGGARENELEWDTGNLGSGLYFIRVVAVTEEGRGQSKTVKVAVAR